MRTQRVVRIVISTVKFWMLTGLLLAGVETVFAQVQHPLAARRVRAHRVQTHRQNVAGAVHSQRQNVADVRRDRVDNVRDHRAAVRAPRVVLPHYAPATVAASGSVAYPPAPPAPVTLPPVENPPPEDNAFEPLGSNELADPFEGSQSYPVTRIEDGGVTVVLKVGRGETKVRMVGVAAVDLQGRVNLPERFAGLRLPSTERFVGHLLKGESVYVVYDTQVAEEDADKKCVAYLFRAPDGLLVNLEVVRAGFAVVDTGYEFDQKSAFIKYQDLARRADKGIYGIITKRINAMNANRPKEN